LMAGRRLFLAFLMVARFMSLANTGYFWKGVMRIERFEPLILRASILGAGPAILATKAISSGSLD